MKTMEDSYLRRCTFLSEASFQGIKTGELHCNETEFRSSVSFRDAYVRHAGGFSSVRFRGPIDGRGWRVSHVSDCDPFVQESSSLDLRGAIFEVPISLRGALVRGESRFSEASFAGGVTFTGAQFGADCDLRSCRFLGATDFSGVRFLRDASFSRCHFAADAMFSDTVFLGVADFEACRFSDPSRVHFVKVNDTEAVGVRFRFADTNLEGIHLDGINWHRLGGRIILQGEIDDRSLSGREAESLESAYRRLYEIFHRTHRYSDAEDCVMGAMEMRRRNPRVDRLTRGVMLFYRVASFYGSSYSRAFEVLLVLILVVFPALYMLPFAHLRERGSATDLWPRIAHQHSMVESAQDHSWLMAADRFRQYRAAAYYSAELAAFRDEPAFVLESPLRGLVFVEQGLAAAQLALFLLAVRRRFAQ